MPPAERAQDYLLTRTRGCAPRYDYTASGLNTDSRSLAIAYKGFAYTLIHPMDYIRGNKCKNQAGNSEK